jgi:small subunit ribosomal protein S3
MSVHKYFVRDNIKKAEIDSYLAQELKKAGYSRVEMTKTPLGTRVVIYAAKPGIVIGRRGQSIRDLTLVFEQTFGMENPQVSVAAIEFPDLDPAVVASQVATALQRGIHFRRAAYWALQRVMAAGALGVEINIRGKLTTERARYERYRDGYLPSVGEPVLKQVKHAVVEVQLKQGLFGVQVRILPPGATFPDRPEIKTPGQVAAEHPPEAKAEVTEGEEEEEEETEEVKEAANT